MITFEFQFLRIFSLGAIILWFLVYWKLGRHLLNDLRKTLPFRATRLDGILMTIITLLSAGVWNSALFICLGRIAFEETAWTQAAAILGMLLLLLGIGGTFYTRRRLGRLWTAAAELQPGHHVIDQGPYARVRHPIYTFAMLLNLGFGLLFPTWYTLLATAVILLAYALKAKGEEKFLLQSLDGYADYMRRVPYRVMPKIW